MADQVRFDVVVVGSGFGGSVSAYRYAEAGRTVLLLERGRRYPPGSFARTPRQMSENFWDPDNGRLGLYQVWKFRDIDGLVSAGLGGGSLIYADVLLRKDASWFFHRRADGTTVPWPITRDELEPHYDAVKQILAPQEFPFADEPYASTPKTLAMQEAAHAMEVEWCLPDLAVTFADRDHPPVPGEPIHDEVGETTNNLHHRTRLTCRLCGECDLGCNYGSKNTLDYNYLTFAEQRGAELRDRCEVKSIAPDGEGYVVEYVDRSGRNDPVLRTVTCDRLVLAAGTFGTNHLLLSNRANFPQISHRLGSQFSGNGDFLGLIHDIRKHGTRRALDPSRGPVITSTMRVSDSVDGGDGPGYYVQDGGYPALVEWIAALGNAPGVAERAGHLMEHEVVDWLHGDRDSDLDHPLEALLNDDGASASMLPLLAMGLDTPSGNITLSRGRLELDWNRAQSSEYFSRVQARMKGIAERLGGKFLADPIGHFHGKVMTVHPVGGCAMSDDPADGVVDAFGEVHGYPRLVVSDGSVMPGPVGPNPSFTIAALADRFATHQLEES